MAVRIGLSRLATRLLLPHGVFFSGGQRKRKKEAGADKRVPFSSRVRLLHEADLGNTSYWCQLLRMFPGLRGHAVLRHKNTKDRPLLHCACMQRGQESS
jgi:hypothetical protein